MRRINSISSYSFPKSTSMPLGCKIKERLYIPDIVVLKDSNILYIIEPESGTGGTTICGKIVLANKSMEIMVEKGSQAPDIKPKLIFLYKPSFPENKIRRIKYRVKKADIDFEYLREIIIDYFPSNWSWFDI